MFFDVSFLLSFFLLFLQITVYHPTDGGHPFANMGWPGSIGMMTGFSAAQMAISEIGVGYPDGMYAT